MKLPVDEQKNNGITALGIACFKGHLEILELLHKAGASLNSHTKRGISPLALAIKSKNFECVKYLIDNKVDVMKSQIQNSEFSPIFLCIKAGNSLMLRYIYENAGRYIDLDKIRTQNGFVPLTYAAYCNQPEIVGYLSFRVKDMNPID